MATRTVQTERFLSQKGYEYRKNRLLPPNAICVVCIASIGKICMTVVPSATNQQINSIIVNQEEYDAYFVYYLLRTKTAILQSIAWRCCNSYSKKINVRQTLRFVFHPLKPNAKSPPFSLPMTTSSKITPAASKSLRTWHKPSTKNGSSISDSSDMRMSRW